MPNVLFIHRCGPGQFAPIALALHHQRPGSVALITAGGDDGVPYPAFAAPPARAVMASHPYLRALEAAVLNGQATARAVLALTRSGRFRPDVVVVHPGWGDALFLRRVLPRVPILLAAEHFYGVAGSDLDHDADLAGDLDRRCALELRNGVLLLGLAAAAAAISPTVWQRNLHPLPYRRRISVIREGVDTGLVRPDPSAAFMLPDGRALTRADEVVTYVARDLEPHRGFPALMRALPSLLAARPRAEVLICGGEGVSYGRPPPGGGSWRPHLLAEIGPLPPRVHFLGRQPYDRSLTLLQASRLHLYSSAPFVLSWSVLEAMAAGCLVLASDTAPVREVIVPGVNGMVADLRDPASFAGCAAQRLAAGDALDPLRRAARRTILARFRRDRALARWSALIERVATQSVTAPASAALAERAHRADSSIPIAATMRGRQRRQSGRSNP